MKAKGGPVPQEILSLRCDQEAAATLMREAAADYAKQQDMAKARAIYQSIVTNFPEEEYGPILVRKNGRQPKEALPFSKGPRRHQPLAAPDDL